MEIQWTVEYKKGEEYEYIDPVTFIADPSWQNDSFDYAGTHCTGGRSGTCKLPSYVSMENSSEITWEKENHTPEENTIIETWLKVDKNREEIEQRFCIEFEKQQREYSDY